jgi:predicted GH43/DUF377 family glycosyl hydrolase
MRGVRWRKLGLIDSIDRHLVWSRSHAIAPTPILLDDSRLRVYFATCDATMVGRVAFVDLDARDPRRVLRRAERPALDIGEAGCFDDNGVSVTSLVRVGDELRMYYFGYQLGVKVRYLLFSGLAISRDGGETFVRHSRVPILDRNDRERFVRSAPCVLGDKTGGYRMWYVSGDDYIDVDGKMVPRYGLRHLHSADGLRWEGIGQQVMDPDGEDEYGFGRPYVVVEDDQYRMWYSVRSRSKWYRIGMATSADGLTWSRQDTAAGIDVSPAAWDSDIVCYPSVITCRDHVYLFYNGNSYGRDGFGMAILASD